MARTTAHVPTTPAAARPEAGAGRVQAADPHARQRTPWRTRALAWAAAAAALLAVSLAYFSPDLMLDLAGSLWRCF